MRYTPDKVPGRDPRLRHSFHTTVVGAVLTMLLVPALAMAVMYPVAAAGVAALAVAAWSTCKALRRARRTRQRRGTTRRVCVPKTGVCVRV